jgi:predicted anti-sigma-YlaC factor YlaD
MNCSAFQERLQRRLDGVFVPADAAEDDHLAGCSRCRALTSAADRLREGLELLTSPAPPRELADRIVRRVLAARRARARRLGYAAVALAASVLAAIVVAQRRQPPIVAPVVAPAPRQLAVNQPPPRPSTPLPLEDSFKDAGTALASLAGRTADEALAQTRVLSAVMPPKALRAGDLWEEPLAPSMRSLREAGHGVSAGLEPLASSARRAVDRFLKDPPSHDER